MSTEKEEGSAKKKEPTLPAFNLAELKKMLPFQWRVQQEFPDYGFIKYVAYIDARQVMELLDEVVGSENWQSKFQMLGTKLFCSLGIFIRNHDEEWGGGEWVWKEDVGTESQIEKDKGQASDALKRAAVHWGIGRFLYDLPNATINARIKEVKNKKGETIRRCIPTDDAGADIKDVGAHMKKKFPHLYK